MKKWTLFISVLMPLVFLAACSSQNSSTTSSSMSTATTGQGVKRETSKSGNEELQLLEASKVGKYLADGRGMTLYYFTKDKPGVSNCKEDCLQKWPPFYAENAGVPTGFNKGDFGTITRADTGQEQTTYKGYPLYYFAKDKIKGDVNGQGVKNAWYIVNSTTSFNTSTTP